MADYITVEFGAGLTLLFGIMRWMLKGLRDELMSLIRAIQQHDEEHRRTTEEGKNALLRLSEGVVRNSESAVAMRESLQDIRQSLRRTDDRMERHERWHQNHKID